MMATKTDIKTIGAIWEGKKGDYRIVMGIDNRDEKIDYCPCTTDGEFMDGHGYGNTISCSFQSFMGWAKEMKQ